MKKNTFNLSIGLTAARGVGNYGSSDGSISIFDPVLCELVYRWFCPLGGTVIDPFAGGSVRGIVAAALGRKYLGHELRAEQVAANQEQWAEISKGRDWPAPIWAIGDSRGIDKSFAGTSGDLIFSCPPYGDLEVYSEDPADLSNMDYNHFLEAYREIVARTCGLLAADRFACFVVGDIRGPDGIYRNFVSDTINAFKDAGARLYNEAILITNAGTLPLRAGAAFSATRKLGKTHQNVLVFIKGNPKRAAEVAGPVQFDDSVFSGLESETMSG